MKTKMVSVRAVEREWKRLIKWDIDQTDLLAFGMSAAKLMITPQQFRPSIAELTVRNHVVDLPDNFALVCQAAYNIKPKDPCTIKEISQWTQKAFEGCDLEINLTCPKCTKVNCNCKSPILEIPVDEMYRQANPQIHSYMKHYHSHGGITDYGQKCFYHPNYILMKAKTGYFDHMQYHIKDCLNMKTDCPVSYQIKDGTQLITSFREGKVLLSYLGYPTDSEGFIMVPDVEEVWEAIVFYIAERVAFSEYFTDMEQKKRIRWQLMTEKRAQTIGRARMRLRVPDPDDWDTIVNNIWFKIVPYTNQWENSNQYQNDTFHHPI